MPPDPPDPTTLTSSSITLIHSPIHVKAPLQYDVSSSLLHLTSSVPAAPQPPVTLETSTLTSTSKTSKITHPPTPKAKGSINLISPSLQITHSMDCIQVESKVKSHPELDTSMIGFGFSDGGYLENEKMAIGWWITDGNELIRSDGALLKHTSSSNNVAEYMGVIKCMRAARALGITRFVMTMDSLLVVSHIKGTWSCSSPHLLVLLQEARQLADEFTFFIIFHTFREDNKVADALCNFAFDDVTNPVGKWNHVVGTLEWEREYHLIEYWMSQTNLSRDWAAVRALVSEEIRSLGPLIRDQWTPDVPSFDAPHHPVEVLTVIDIPTSMHDPTPDAWEYVFPPQAHTEMMNLAAAGNIPWDPSRFKILRGLENKHGVIIYKYPHEDVAYATLLLSRVNWNLKRFIHAWRGQTPSDMRPNKKLDFSRLANVTGGYEDQAALKSLIDSGYELHWRSPFSGTRPLPTNHQSAEVHHEIMGAQILKHYHSGRLILLDASAVAEHVPEFTTSPYACVPKAHKPLTKACRPIHDQSSPGEKSVNANLDPALRPHAQWPASKAIADRILRATALYGTETLYGFNTDIADAFLNIGLHANDVPVNGGILPDSNIAALATTAIFGNCESPGAFRILNCVSHVHGSNASYINNVNTPFDIRFYVDDGNCIEPNVGSRLLDAEKSLRKSTELVFGPNCIQESKTTPWAKVFTSLGFEWNLHDGTTSIPAEKLERVRVALEEFSSAPSASLSDFRSIVGKLRHVATVCPPAKALLHLLGLKLHSTHHRDGRTHRPITAAIRSELQWWAKHLSPSMFYKLPVEWMGTSLPPVDQWIHVYSKVDVGVWLVDFLNNSSSFLPWKSSLDETVVSAIQEQLEPATTPPLRMFHTRFIFNECRIARMINSGSSSNSSLRLPLRESCLWQLQHRHRFTATSTKWENMPEIIFNPCKSHVSNFTNFLSLQISCSMKSDAPCRPRLINGNSPLSAKVRSKRMGRIFVTGSNSRFPFNCQQSSLMNYPRMTNPLSWHGSQSPVENMVTTARTKEINSQLIKSRSLRSYGHTSTTETPYLTSTVPLCRSLKLATDALSTFPIRSNPFMLTCCPNALPNSAFGTSPKGNWRGAVSYYNSFSSVEQESFGTPVDKQSMLCQPQTSKLNPAQIIGSKPTTWSSRTNLETTSRSGVIISQPPSPLRSTTLKPIRWDEEIQSQWELLDIDPFARSKALLWHCAREPLGKSPTRTTHSQVELKRQRWPQSSRKQPERVERTQLITRCTLSELDTPRCFSNPDMTSLSSDWLGDGPVKWSHCTPGFPVVCY